MSSRNCETGTISKKKKRSRLSASWSQSSRGSFISKVNFAKVKLFCDLNLIFFLVTKRECQMKTDHQGLVDEIEKLNGQVGKGKQALDTKQAEENELRSELVVRH